ncbi:VanW family protein [Luteipulveratus halotolerans]|uniref:YoaR-like putative peptidoglycan binding domain-containing protein n=1 Tax=Luteipulveratus halotolerans TaxID=1631356 RepID=A0A0L6CFZ0_9MICO|nr:VanW family protein [Luteipulveratus halotolerans]KNX36495.1 hypothetical protein VV01_03940 [Luteipulveratus halotolerans]
MSTKDEGTPKAEQPEVEESAAEQAADEQGTPQDTASTDESGASEVEPQDADESVRESVEDAADTDAADTDAADTDAADTDAADTDAADTDAADTDAADTDAADTDAADTDAADTDAADTDAADTDAADTDAADTDETVVAEPAVEAESADDSSDAESVEDSSDAESAEDETVVAEPKADAEPVEDETVVAERTPTPEPEDASEARTQPVDIRKDGAPEQPTSAPDDEVVEEPADDDATVVGAAPLPAPAKPPRTEQVSATPPARPEPTPAPEPERVARPEQPAAGPDPDATQAHPIGHRPVAAGAAAPAYDLDDLADDQAEGTTARPATAPSPKPARDDLLRNIWLRVGVLAFVLIGAYVALALWEGDRISSGTTVAGVEVGGLSKADATAKLNAEATRLAAQPVSVTVGEDRVQLQPASAGLALDVPKSLDGLGGRGFGPGRVFGYFTGGEDRAGVVKTDSAKVAEAVDKAAAPLLTSAPVDGSVKFEDGEVEVVRSKPGQGIDSDAVAAQISKGWPGKRQYSAPIGEREGRLKNAEIDRFVSTFAYKAMSGDITVTDGSAEASLSPKQMSAYLSVKNDRGRLTPVLDTEKLVDKIAESEPKFDKPARNARIELTGGQPKITPAQDGSQIDRAKVGPAVLAALTSESRTATVPTSPVKAKITTEQVKSVNTTTAISEFRSRFPGGESNAARTKNIKVALSILNGQVVAPGEQFSLVNALGGEMTAEQGYVDAPTIQGGRERPAMGGGVSQVSTTVYNTAFFAGVQLDEHKPHSFWIKRYPMGREATLWIPSLDNKWTNDTGAPILIQAGTEGNEVVMRFYGKKAFTVTTTTGKPRNKTQPKKVYDEHPECIEVSPNPGFTVDVFRTVKKGSEVVKNEKITTTYKAADDIVCGKAPAGSSTKPPSKSTEPPQD